jgi:hypothetical protein
MQPQAAPGFPNEAGAHIRRPRRTKPNQRAKEMRRRIQIMRNKRNVMDGPGHDKRLPSQLPPEHGAARRHPASIAATPGA